MVENLPSNAGDTGLISVQGTKNLSNLLEFLVLLLHELLADLIDYYHLLFTFLKIFINIFACNES